MEVLPNVAEATRSILHLIGIGKPEPKRKITKVKINRDGRVTEWELVGRQHNWLHVRRYSKESGCWEISTVFAGDDRVLVLE